MFFFNYDRTLGKKVFQRFQTSYGVGRNKSKQLARCLGFSRRTRVTQTAMLHRYNLAALSAKEKYTSHSKRKEIILNLPLDFRLKMAELRAIGKKMKMHCYQGIRHNYNLPVHGQRTHSHGATQRRLGAKRNLARSNMRAFFKRQPKKQKRKFTKKEMEIIRLKKKIRLRRQRRLRKHARVKFRRRPKGVLTKK
jgi:small subunit ribosomal protein S13